MRNECTHPNCNRQATYHKRTLCRKHWQNARRNNLIPGKPCSIQNCDRNATARGYCAMHYERWLTHGDPLKRAKKANGEGALQQGYMTFKNDDPDGPTRIREHVRIMEEHLGRPVKADEQVHHINENRTDNRIENLEIMTRAEHSALHHKGTRNANAKLNPEKVRTIRTAYESGSRNQYQLADQYGVHQTAISNIINRRTWKHID
jgi:antitoxin component HigA of HigAB toxin-antitoxin module